MTNINFYNIAVVINDVDVVFHVSNNYHVSKKYKKLKRIFNFLTIMNIDCPDLFVSKSFEKKIKIIFNFKKLILLKILKHY